MHSLKDGFETFDILFLFGFERVECALGLSGRVDAPFDALPLQKDLRTKSRRDDADRAND